jgi:ABC-2 type transport system ATP-binding protein
VTGSASSSAVVAEGLTKQYGATLAVDNLTFELPTGGVVGFLGLNGAGKSTTIRMLLGLIRPSSGSARVFGASITTPHAYLHRVGALVEAPVAYPSLSGEVNLAALAVLMGQPRSRVGEVLEQVGLAGRGQDRVAEYSLGMKQRLGIAAALLRDPELLVLDEPTNGLDPAGIVEVRTLLRHLGASGKTVFVSSHILAEMHAACDRFLVINHGRFLFAGPVDEFLSQARRGVTVHPEHAVDLDRLGNLVSEAGFRSTPDGPSLWIDAPADAAADLNRLAQAHDITLSALMPASEDIEDLFLRLTGREAAEA